MIPGLHIRLFFKVLGTLTLLVQERALNIPVIQSDIQYVHEMIFSVYTHHLGYGRPIPGLFLNFTISS